MATQAQQPAVQPALPWNRRLDDPEDDNHRGDRRTPLSTIGLIAVAIILAILAVVFAISASSNSADVTAAKAATATAVNAKVKAEGQVGEWKTYSGKLEKDLKAIGDNRDEWKNTARERGEKLAAAEKKLAAAQRARTAAVGAAPELQVRQRTWKTGTTADGGTFRHNCLDGIERPLIPTLAEVGAGRSGAITCERIVRR